MKLHFVKSKEARDLYIRFSFVRRKKLWRYTRPTTCSLITLNDECLPLDLLMKAPFARRGIEFHFCTDLSGTSHNLPAENPPKYLVQLTRSEKERESMTRPGRKVHK